MGPGEETQPLAPKVPSTGGDKNLAQVRPLASTAKQCPVKPPDCRAGGTRSREGLKKKRS